MYLTVSVRIQENADQKKLRIWTLFTQCFLPRNFFLIIWTDVKLIWMDYSGWAFSGLLTNGGGGQKGPPSLKSVTDILQWWNTWHTPWVLLTLAFFQRKSANLATSRNTDKDCIISNSFNFFKVFKDFFNKHGYNFDDVSKNGYLGLLKAEFF